MSISTAALHKAIMTVWNDSGLDTTFKALWPSGTETSQFYTLHDQEASPGHPWPYAVFDQMAVSVVNRMSDDSNRKEVRDTTFAINVYAREVVGDSRTAKAIAATLVEEVMKFFGGHPTESPSDLVLENGNYLITQYLNDFGDRIGDEEYRWMVVYSIRTDIPVAN